MKTIHAEIKSISAMLMHSDRTANPLDEFSKALKKFTSKRKKTEEDYLAIAKLEFEASCYYESTNGWYMPCANIEATLLNSAKHFKKGTLIKQAIIVPENGTFSFPDDNLKPTQLFKKSEYVDMRTVKVGTQKVVRTRPIFHEWRVSFVGFLDTNKMEPDEIKEIIENAGKYVGLGDYRPRYGRFELISFKVK